MNSSNPTSIYYFDLCFGLFLVYLYIYSVSLLFGYMCVRLPFIACSIAGVPSSKALPGYLITTHHLCAFLMYLAS